MLIPGIQIIGIVGTLSLTVVALSIENSLVSHFGMFAIGVEIPVIIFTVMLRRKRREKGIKLGIWFR